MRVAFSSLFTSSDPALSCSLAPTRRNVCAEPQLEVPGGEMGQHGGNRQLVSNKRWKQICQHIHRCLPSAVHSTLCTPPRYSSRPKHPRALSRVGSRTVCKQKYVSNAPFTDMTYSSSSQAETRASSPHAGEMKMRHLHTLPGKHPLAASRAQQQLLVTVTASSGMICSEMVIVCEVRVSKKRDGGQVLAKPWSRKLWKGRW
jgi:hypothetical protein